MSRLRGYVRRGSRGRWHDPIRYGASKSVIYVRCGRVLTAVERSSAVELAQRCEKCLAVGNGVDRMSAGRVI